MRHFWHSKLSLVATSGVVIGMTFGLWASASAHTRQANARHAGPTPSHAVYFSDWQFPATLSPLQVGTVVETESTGLTQPTGNDVILDNTGSTAYPQMDPTYGGSPCTTPSSTEIDCELNHGMEWSNGTLASAADYLLAWKVQMNVNTGPACAGTCDHVQSIDLPDANASCLDGVAGDDTPGNCGYRIKINMNPAAPYRPEIPNAFVGFLPTNPTSSAQLGTPTQIAQCLADNTAGFPACDTTAQDLELPGVNYLPGGTGGVGTTMGPMVVTLFSPGALEVDFSPSANFNAPTCDCSAGTIAGEPQGPGGGQPAMKFLGYASLPNMVAAADNNDTDVTNDYTYLQLPALQSDSHFNTHAQAATANPEFLQFNTRTPTPHIDNGPSGTVVSPVDGQAGSAGQKVRDALFLAVNWPKLMHFSYAVSNADSVRFTSYCGVPAFCSIDNHAQFGSDFNNEGGGPNTNTSGSNLNLCISAPNGGKCGRWDPLKSKFIKPGTSTAIADAKTLFNANCSCTSSKPAKLFLSTTTGNVTRTQEQTFLNNTWSTVFGSHIKVTSVNVPAAKYFNIYKDGGTLANGHFEAAIYAFGGTPADPDSTDVGLFNTLPAATAHCPQTNHAASSGAYSCYMNSGTNAAIVTGATHFGATAISAYQTLSQLLNKGGVFMDMAPRPKIETEDGKPASGYSYNPWPASDTWNAQNWNQ